MPDMLVKLYALPHWDNLRDRLSAQSVIIRRAIAPELHLVVKWVRENFGEGWASETTVAFSNHPVSCYIATQDGKTLGFACYDAACRNFFGPTGVAETERGRGVGKALLLATLEAMAADGFGYAIIGAAGPTGFYEKAVGATAIPDSVPGIYRGMLGS